MKENSENTLPMLHPNSYFSPPHVQPSASDLPEPPPRDLPELSTPPACNLSEISEPPLLGMTQLSKPTLSKSESTSPSSWWGYGTKSWLKAAGVVLSTVGLFGLVRGYFAGKGYFSGWFTSQGSGGGTEEPGRGTDLIERTDLGEGTGLSERTELGEGIGLDKKSYLAEETKKDLANAYPKLQGAAYPTDISALSNSASAAHAHDIAAQSDSVRGGMLDAESLSSMHRPHQLEKRAFSLEFQVNTYTTSGQGDTAVTGLDGGGFVVAWQSFEQDGDANGIYAQRYDGTGAVQGPEFQVNTYTTGGQSRPAVTSLSRGGFVVAWQSYGQDGDRYGIYAQQCDGTGAAQGPEFQVNTYTTSYQADPAVVGLSSGGFVVVWHSGGQDGDGSGVYAQRYDGTGAAQGPEFQVNTYTTSFH